MASSIQSKLPVELSTISAAQGIQLLSITFVVFVIASKLLFAPKKLGKALPTPGGTVLDSNESKHINIK